MTLEMNVSEECPQLITNWKAFENLSVVNMKKWELVFEQGELKVIAPLDPKEGRRYVETIKEGMVVEGLDNIYKVTMWTEDYINPTTDGNISWIGSEVCELPHYDGLTDIATFLVEFENVVVEQQRLLALDVALRTTPMRLWATHKTSIQDWS